MALGHPDQEEKRVFKSPEDLGLGHSLLPRRVGKPSSQGSAWEGRRQLRWGRVAAAGGRRGVLQAAQLRRPEQLRGPACAPWGAPSPSPSPHPGEAERALPPQPLGGLLHSAEGGGDKDAPQSLYHSLECSQQSALGTRGRAARPELRAPGGPRSPAQGPGGGAAPGAVGGGGDRDFALCLSLSLSAEPPAETRPHRRARQPAWGRLPLRGSLVNPDPTSPWSGP